MITISDNDDDLHIENNTLIVSTYDNSASFELDEVLKAIAETMPEKYMQFVDKQMMIDFS